ncbi:hypothetical protein F5B19DRAFT_457186 [Rostrohypoxylon terebratum]|nr:hypothetical protein F5B19DRAFT_457186 [Rostrohypoxylon terebratum]
MLFIPLLGISMLSASTAIVYLRERPRPTMSPAPAVTKDGFSYAGDFFAETSGHNQHRRAAIMELKSHFKSGSEKDHPAHWFEAQLIHYGLPPSKTKAVARMRLYDAVNGNYLSVPSHIKKLELDLKKEWMKNERESKKALKETVPPAVKFAKRKAESSNVDVTVNVEGVNITVSTTNASKKAKTANPKRPSQTTKKQPESKAKAKALKAVAAPKPKAPASRQKIKEEPSTSPWASVSAFAAPTHRKQTARRGGSFASRGQAAGTVSNDFSYPGGEDSSWPTFKPESFDGHGSDPNHRDVELRPLGLLNGCYGIEAPYVTDEWDHTDLSLVLTLSGSELWGKFDLGIIEGILHFPQRPYVSSHDAVNFTWRGQELDGPVVHGNGNKGWIRFLGDGQIEGFLDWMRIEFHGTRLSGQGTRSDVEARTMQFEWNEYNETEYEQANRDRWG